MCWTFLGTQSMISSQRLGQNLLDLRGKMRLTTLTVFDERPKPQPELFNLEQISQVGRKWITVQQPPASSRGCAYHCAGYGLCTTVVVVCTTVVVVCTTVVVMGSVPRTIVILGWYSMTPTDRQPPFANFFTTPNNLQSLEILWTKSPQHNRWLATLCNFWSAGFCLYRQYLYFYFEFRALCHIHGFVRYK